MNTAKRKATGKKALTAAMLAGGLALTGLGFASGTAQAQKPHQFCYDVCEPEGCYRVCV